MCVCPNVQLLSLIEADLKNKNPEKKLMQEFGTERVDWIDGWVVGGGGGKIDFAL